MAAVVNGSFPSPAANADFTSALKAEDAGILSHVYHGLNGWSIALTLFVILVAYDQCKRLAPQRVVFYCVVAESSRSQVRLEERINCWSGMEDPVHWTLLGVRESEDGRIQGEMGQRRAELRFRIP